MGGGTGKAALHAAALLLTSACAAVPAQPTAPGAAASLGEVDSIAMGTFSWGKPVSEWRIDRSGEGTYTVSERAPSGDFHEYDLVVRRIMAGPEDFARLREVLRGAERYAYDPTEEIHTGNGNVERRRSRTGRSRLECETVYTDAAYGQLTWEHGGLTSAVGYNFGCQSAAANAVHRQLAEAERLVESWAASAPITERREVRVPR